MKQQGFFSNIRVTATTLVCLILGCGTSAEGVGTGIRLERISQSENGFESVFVNGAASTTIVVSRTGARVHDFVRDPDIDSPYEANISVFNRDGYPFLVNGLHDFQLNPHTGEFNFAISAIPTQEAQLEDLLLVREAADALSRQFDIGDRFRWELRNVVNFSDHARRVANAVFDGRIVPEPDVQLQGLPPGATGRITVTPEAKPSDHAEVTAGNHVGTLSLAHSSPFIHNVAVTHANCCWIGYEHSAVLVDSYYNDGHYIGTLSTKNHGREAVDPSMAVVAGCPRSFSGRPTSVPPLQPYVSTDTSGNGDAGGCNTSYGVHVCNDDSYAEYSNAKYNAAYSWSECNAPMTTAPSCY